MSDLVRLISDSLITINRIASILDENGISVMIKDNRESGRLAGFGTSQNDVDLYINASDIERAKEIVERFLEEG